MSQSSLVMPAFVLITTGHFSNSARFCGNDKILQLGSKFRDPRKTVGPSDIEQHGNNCRQATAAYVTNRVQLTSLQVVELTAQVSDSAAILLHIKHTTAMVPDY